MKRKLRDDETQIDELENEELASDSAGQSGDAQGLPQTADADEESVEELAETDQAYEAEAVDGLDDAADHLERPVHTREDKGR
jgi:predicted NBD/HSP70 family sugar kinase